MADGDSVITLTSGTDMGLPVSVLLTPPNDSSPLFSEESEDTRSTYMAGSPMDDDSPPNSQESFISGTFKPSTSESGDNNSIYMTDCSINSTAIDVQKSSTAQKEASRPWCTQASLQMSLVLGREARSSEDSASYALTRHKTNSVNLGFNELQKSSVLPLQDIACHQSHVLSLKKLCHSESSVDPIPYILAAFSYPQEACEIQMLISQESNKPVPESMIRQEPIVESCLPSRQAIIARFEYASRLDFLTSKTNLLEIKTVAQAQPDLPSQTSLYLQKNLAQTQVNSHVTISEHETVHPSACEPLHSFKSIPVPQTNFVFAAKMPGSLPRRMQWQEAPLKSSARINRLTENTLELKPCIAITSTVRHEIFQTQYFSSLTCMEVLQHKDCKEVIPNEPILVSEFQQECTFLPNIRYLPCSDSLFYRILPLDSQKKCIARKFGFTLDTVQYHTVMSMSEPVKPSYSMQARIVSSDRVEKVETFIIGKSGSIIYQCDREAAVFSQSDESLDENGSAQPRHAASPDHPKSQHLTKKEIRASSGESYVEKVKRNKHSSRSSVNSSRRSSRRSKDNSAHRLASGERVHTPKSHHKRPPRERPHTPRDEHNNGNHQHVHVSSSTEKERGGGHHYDSIMIEQVQSLSKTSEKPDGIVTIVNAKKSGAAVRNFKQEMKKMGSHSGYLGSLKNESDRLLEESWRDETAAVQYDQILSYKASRSKY